MFKVNKKKHQSDVISWVAGFYIIIRHSRIKESVLWVSRVYRNTALLLWKFTAMFIWRYSFSNKYYWNSTRYHSTIPDSDTNGYITDQTIKIREIFLLFPKNVPIWRHFYLKWKTNAFIEPLQHKLSKKHQNC